jgi:hypothetical protein
MQADGVEVRAEAAAADGNERSLGSAPERLGALLLCETVSSSSALS